MIKKRGKIPSLITGSSGRPIKVIAKRRRPCCYCPNEILLSEACFEVPKIGTGFSSKKTYCLNCFISVLEQTKKDLNNLEQSTTERL